MNWTRLRSNTSFEQVREQVTADDAGKWDTLVAREHLVLKDGALTVPLDDCGEHIESLTPTAWATGQFCQRLGIPVSYFRRCPTVLQDMQANFWLKNPPVEENGRKGRITRNESAGQKSEQWLLRARYGSLRAVLSERYTRLDNEALLGSVQQVLNTASSQGFDIKWFDLGDESLHLRLVDPTVGKEALPDDRLMAGVHIANSEVGKRAVTVDAMVFRLVCTNGLIRLVKGKSLLHQRHIHVAQEQFADALETAVAEALKTSAGFMEQLAFATREPVKDVEETLSRIAKHWSLSQSTQEQMKRSLLAERPDQQETLYGMVNALTNAAQLLPADDRYDLEVLAGHLVEHGISESLTMRNSLRQIPIESEVNGYGNGFEGGSRNGRRSLATASV